jgi:hypothetical protein
MAESIDYREVKLPARQIVARARREPPAPRVQPILQPADSPGEPIVRFERSAMKNWLLAGLVPWSSFSSDDLLAENGPVLRYENLQVETEFNAIDTILWIVPGQFYGYYVWAPRHITVTGDEVRSGAAAR